MLPRFFIALHTPIGIKSYDSPSDIIATLKLEVTSHDSDMEVFSLRYKLDYEVWIESSHPTDFTMFQEGSDPEGFSVPFSELKLDGRRAH